MAIELETLRLEMARLTLRPLRDEDLDEMCLLLGDRDALALWGEPLGPRGCPSLDRAR